MKANLLRTCGAGLLGVTLALGCGCGEPLDNGPFEDDAAFRAALPTAEQVALSEPESVTGRIDAAECETGELFDLTFNTMGYINSVTRQLLSGIDAVRGQPITTRTEDSRTWGPYPVEDVGGFLTLTIERRQVREADQLTDWYFYWLNHGQTASDPGASVLWGRWDPEYDLVRGVGEMTWDHGFFTALNPDARQAEGFVTQTYDTRETRRVSALLDDIRDVGAPEGSGTTIECDYEASAGGGWFSYENRSDIVQVSEVKERLDVTSRWLADGSGRAEGHYSDGDLGMTVVSLAECWDTAGCETWYRDTHGLSEPVGDEAQCTLTDVVIP